MVNIKLILEYDGTGYHGWQSQRGSGRKTIQETLELALRRICGEPVVVASSGRTDAGVHATGHVANFTTSHPLPPAAWTPVLNRLLSSDIRVLSSEEVPGEFHARHSAAGKTYRYLILNRTAPSALYRSRAWHIAEKLNVSAMRRAAALLLGRHDFSAFRSSGCNAASPVRRLTAVSLRKTGDFIYITLEADAFLMHMARTIVGTLVDVGRGRFAPGDVRKILASRDRSRAGKTAPAQGLYLEAVRYGSRKRRSARRPHLPLKP